MENSLHRARNDGLINHRPWYRRHQPLYQHNYRRSSHPLDSCRRHLDFSNHQNDNKNSPCYHAVAWVKPNTESVASAGPSAGFTIVLSIRKGACCPPNPPAIGGGFDFSDARSFQDGVPKKDSLFDSLSKCQKFCDNRVR